LNACATLNRPVRATRSRGGVVHLEAPARQAPRRRIELEPAEWLRHPLSLADGP